MGSCTASRITTVKLTRRGGVRNAWPESAFRNKLGSPVTVAGTMGIGAGHSYRTTSKRLADSGRLFKSGSNDAVQPNNPLKLTPVAQLKMNSKTTAGFREPKFRC